MTSEPSSPGAHPDGGSAAGRVESGTAIVVEVARTMHAAPADVWRALVDAEQRADWWGHLDLDARVGGRFGERWTDATGEAVVTRGDVLELVPDERLRLRWADEGWPADTEVTLRLEPAGGGTRVRVRHEGWERLPGGEELAAAHRDGWTMHLANLDAQVARRHPAG